METGARPHQQPPHHTPVGTGGPPRLISSTAEKGLAAAPPPHALTPHYCILPPRPRIDAPYFTPPPPSSTPRLPMTSVFVASGLRLGSFVSAGAWLTIGQLLLSWIMGRWVREPSQDITKVSKQF